VARALVLLACLILLPVMGAHAQPFQTQDPGTGAVAVGGAWQFHTGDNLAWANPAYNDSGWQQLHGDETWGAQTHSGYTGFAWYRKQIDVSGTNSKLLAILIPPVEDAYEIYWNGRKIGSYGSLPPHAAWWIHGHDAVYTLGSAPARGLLALRVWKAPLTSIDPWTIGGLTASPALGNPAVLHLHTIAQRYGQEHLRVPNLLMSVVILVAGLLTLLLFLRDRKEWLYLWLGVYLVADGLASFLILQVNSLHLTAFLLFLQLKETFGDFSLWLLLLTLFGLIRERRWQRWTVVLMTVYLVAQAMDLTLIFNWQHAGLGMQWVDGVTTAIVELAPIYILFIVGFGLARRRQRALWPLGIAASLYGAWSALLMSQQQGRRFTHWTLDQLLSTVGFRVSGYFLDPTFLLNTLLFVVLVFTVARQQLQERRRQTRIDSEILSAREVQQVLVPEDVPAIPGFSIASIYKPATELGGDFYQVIPTELGGALVIVGDVSGKGLRAAMIVSLIVGTLRTLAETTEEPAEILRGLNRRLIGRTQGGFATCVVMHIESNGSAALATAGHFAPFRDGKELPLDGSLPLGLDPDAPYEEIVFRLHENETLTFYTDGIVEARDSHGQLFGFDRVRDLARAGSSAVEIAEVASAFGQDDDITVLTLTRLAATDPAQAASVNLSTQIATA
jgi:hypothetical protein